MIMRLLKRLWLALFPSKAVETDDEYTHEIEYNGIRKNKENRRRKRL